MKRSAEAVSARQRVAPEMKHRNSPRGGARNLRADTLAELQDADGLEMNYQDSDTLTECCPVGCKHNSLECKIPSPVVFCETCSKFWCMCEC